MIVSKLNVLLMSRAEEGTLYTDVYTHALTYQPGKHELPAARRQRWR